MSTLKVNTIQNTSGGSSSTPVQIEQGRAKMWLSLDGTGTISIRDSFNVSSVADNATGDYTANIDSDMADGNYCVQVTGGNAAASGTGAWNTVYAPANTASTSVRVAFYSNAGGNQDNSQVMIAIFGDQ